MLRVGTRVGLWTGAPARLLLAAWVPCPSPCASTPATVPRSGLCTHLQAAEFVAWFLCS